MKAERVFTEGHRELESHPPVLGKLKKMRGKSEKKRKKGKAGGMGRRKQGEEVVICNWEGGHGHCDVLLQTARKAEATLERYIPGLAGNGKQTGKKCVLELW